MPYKKNTFLIFLNVTVLLLLCILTIILSSYAQISTLYDNGNWISTKMSLEKGVLGAAAFMVTKTAVYKNRLNLGAWQGFQEIIYKNEITPSLVEFDFLLGKQSYTIFVFNKNNKGFSGLRFSTDPSYNTVHFTANSEGKFLNKTFLDLPNLKINNWNHARIDFSNNSFSLHINGKYACNFNKPILTAQHTGFKGGIASSYIDNVIISDKNKGIVLTENFGNIKITLPAFLIIVTTILLNFLFVTFSSNNKKLIFKILSFNILITIIVSLSYLTYIFVFVGQYPTSSNGIDWKGLKTNIENETTVVQRILSTYTAEKAMGTKRILFLGSSQTWGAGATTENKTFVRQLENMLNRKSNKCQEPPAKAKWHEGITNSNPKKQVVLEHLGNSCAHPTISSKRILANEFPTYELINGGISGLHSKRIFEIYRDQLLRLNPDIVIMDLSNNDWRIPVFNETLPQFISLNNKHKIKTIFILEPNSLGSQIETRLLTNHNIMRELAQKNNVPLIDMPAHLTKYHDTGFLWWDSVHLTDYGQRIFAEKIATTLTTT